MADLSLARAQLQTSLEDKQITPAWFTVGRAILFYANRQGTCWPSYETLAHKAGCSIKTVSRAIHGLREIGWLSWQTRRTRWRRRLTNMYRVLAAVDKSRKPREEISLGVLRAVLSRGSRGELLGGVFARVEQLALNLSGAERQTLASGDARPART